MCSHTFAPSERKHVVNVLSYLLSVCVGGLVMSRCQHWVSRPSKKRVSVGSLCSKIAHKKTNCTTNHKEGEDKVVSAYALKETCMYGCTVHVHECLPPWCAPPGTTTGQATSSTCLKCIFCQINSIYYSPRSGKGFNSMCFQNTSNNASHMCLRV